eukprot:31246-Pelagococcus_subviridis.AAC.9
MEVDRLLSHRGPALDLAREAARHARHARARCDEVRRLRDAVIERDAVRHRRREAARDEVAQARQQLVEETQRDDDRGRDAAAVARASVARGLAELARRAQRAPYARVQIFVAVEQVRAVVRRRRVEDAAVEVPQIVRAREHAHPHPARVDVRVEVRGRGEEVVRVVRVHRAERGVHRDAARGDLAAPLRDADVRAVRGLARGRGRDGNRAVRRGRARLRRPRAGEIDGVRARETRGRAGRRGLADGHGDRRALRRGRGFIALRHDATRRRDGRAPLRMEREIFALSCSQETRPRVRFLRFV